MRNKVRWHAYQRMNRTKPELALVKKRELARSLGVSTRTVDGWVRSDWFHTSLQVSDCISSM